MTIYRTPVPNKVIITSLSHFNYVFKMAEIADEPDGYLSDGERDSVSKQKKKAAAEMCC